MSPTIQFSVRGTPRPGGSKKAIPHKATRRIIVIDMSGKKGREWRRAVADAGGIAMASAKFEPFDGPLEVSMLFGMPRPKCHGKTKGGAPMSHTQRPDVLKLARAVEDALTGVVWVDDSQIVDEHLSKFWTTEGGGVLVTVRPVPTLTPAGGDEARP